MKTIKSKCPTCGKVSKRIIGKPGWYYCRNMSCNMTAYKGILKRLE